MFGQTTADYVSPLWTSFAKRCRVLAAVIACCCATVHFLSRANGQENNATDSPSWMIGESTWTGQGYVKDDTTDASAKSITVTEPGGLRLNPYATQGGVDSYTVPIGPTVVAPSVATDGSAVMTAGDAAMRSDDPQKLQTSSAVAQVAHAQAVPEPIQNAASDLSLGTLGTQIDAGVTMQTPPLAEESARWYSYPWRWATQGWTNSIELGLDGSQGNAETFALQTGAELKRQTDAYTLAFDFDYRLVNARDVVTEDNGRFNIDYDRLLGDSPWSLFGKFGLEWDEFKAFDLRLNLNSGLGYHWIRNDRSTFVTRFGAGASREIGAPIDDWIAEAVFGMEAEHQVNKRNKVKAKVDYFPSWEDFGDFRLVSDASWEILLSDDDSLSLKLAVTDRYDSTPQGGNRENDVYYSLLLLVKF